jgi:phage tail sheath protein FI
MALGYKHGTYFYEVPTSIIPPRRTSAGIPVVFGTSPLHRASGGSAPVNDPVLAYTYADAVEQLGFEEEDWDNYTISEFVKSYYSLYKMAPAIFINVFDPSTHKGEVTSAESLTFAADDTATLANADVLPGTLSLEPDGGGTAYIEGTDYEIDEVAGVITRLEGGSIASEGTAEATYEYADPSAVVADDIVGGVDSETGQLMGLELVDKVFPKFRILPGTIAAPGWSQDPATAVVMGAKCTNINGHFKAMCVVDVDDASCTKYQDVPQYKNDNNLTDEHMIVCWPRVKLDKTYWLSTHMAGLLARTDGENEGVPYMSPSNKRLENLRAVANGEEVWLGPEMANYLNGNGVVTALNFIGGWRAWGNRTGTYPATTDPKDAFIPIRRMFNWIGNTLVLTYWQKVDYPITKRLIETIMDSTNIWLNGLQAREYILGGRCEFQEGENPVTDLMDGIVRFHVNVTPPPPAREIQFILEYDPQYFETLFA